MRRSGRRVLALALGVVAILATTPDAVVAQGSRRTNVTVSGFPLTLAGASLADFDAGFVLLGTTAFAVDLRTNSGGGGFSPRVTTVNVNCGAGCPASVADLQWRRVDQGAWNSLTTTPALVETRTAAFNGLNDPWSNSMEWRLLLSWATSGPQTALLYPIDFQLVVTAP